MTMLLKVFFKGLGLASFSLLTFFQTGINQFVLYGMYTQTANSVYVALLV